MSRPFWPDGVRELPPDGVDKPPHVRIPELSARLLRLAKAIENYADADLSRVDQVPGPRTYYQSLDFETRRQHYEQLRSACFRLKTVAGQLDYFVDELFDRPALSIFKASREREIADRESIEDTLHGRTL
jgi:hypothetical protein